MHPIHRSLLLVPFAFACAAASLSAQTFIVDAANGPGAHYTDLPAAVAAAPDGAVLLVRPGTYGGISLQAKGLTILATAPGVQVSATNGLNVFVASLAANQSFTLRGVTIVQSMSFVRCLLRDCAGQVLIDDVTSQSSGTTYYDVFFRGIVLERCAHATLRSCRLGGYRGLYTIDSDVAVEGSELIGHDGFFVPHVGTYPGTGAVVEGGTLVLSRCTVRGGNGLGTLGPSPAIDVWRGTVRLCDDANGVYAAGQLPATLPQFAVAGAGTLVRDPSVVFASAGGASFFAPTLTSVVRPLPSLRTVAGPPGGTVAADVTTPVGEAVLLGLSLVGPAAAIPGVDGSVRLDPATAILVAAGVPQPGAPLVHTIAVPNLPWLVGFRFAWQAFAFSAADGLRASNPSIYAH